jgi:hypothetical protein
VAGVRISHVDSDRMPVKMHVACQITGYVENPPHSAWRTMYCSRKAHFLGSGIIWPLAVRDPVLNKSDALLTLTEF